MVLPGISSSARCQRPWSDFQRVGTMERSVSYWGHAYLTWGSSRPAAKSWGWLLVLPILHRQKNSYLWRIIICINPKKIAKVGSKFAKYKITKFPKDGWNICQIVKSCPTAWYLLHLNYKRSFPRPRIYRPRTPDFFALLFMLYSTAAYVSYKFEREIQIQSNDLNSLAASIQEMLLGKRFQRRTRSIN